MFSLLICTYQLPAIANFLVFLLSKTVHPCSLDIIIHYHIMYLSRTKVNFHSVFNFQKYNLFHIFQVINIVVGDGLPKFICTDCQGVINKFTDFCNMVQDVQRRLEEEKLDFSQVRKFLSPLHA